MPLKIIRNDITKVSADAIVNTANPEPKYSYGTDTAVYKAAGEEELLKERRKIGHINEGDVAITSAFRLPAKYIIHAVSPRYIDGSSGEEEKLRACYSNSLKIGAQYGCKSIAFPLIATGSFSYPKEEGMRIALDEINAFLMNQDMLVYLVVFDGAATKLGMNLYPDLEAYIDHNYVCHKYQEEYQYLYPDNRVNNCCGFDVYNRKPKDKEGSQENVKAPERKMRTGTFAPRFNKSSSVCDTPMMVSENTATYSYGDDIYTFSEKNQSALNERMEHLSDTFQQYLIYLINTKHMTNAEVYKRAIVTKQLFSKIKLNPGYHPDKATAMRLCVGAKLNIDETKDLLARAGYALSPCDKRDIIFSFFIEHEVFDMIEIDIALEEHGLPCFIE